jgi:hypothetical protein
MALGATPVFPSRKLCTSNYAEPVAAAMLNNHQLITSQVNNITAHPTKL